MIEQYSNGLIPLPYSSLLCDNNDLFLQSNLFGCGRESGYLVTKKALLVRVACVGVFSDKGGITCESSLYWGI